MLLDHLAGRHRLEDREIEGVDIFGELAFELYELRCRDSVGDGSRPSLDQGRLQRGSIRQVLRQRRPGPTWGDEVVGAGRRKFTAKRVPEHLADFGPRRARRDRIPVVLALIIIPDALQILLVCETGDIDARSFAPV